ncbi:hypothetical protein Ahy_B05g079590 [Arachis hypogaea]|uniref:CCHC-type domain-containing protein n=1 Tax=Arachis hypogaea TaxID=3818 RepID=A0A444ZAC1_ARAHY|nr:hypothetical protein Ahy_B05g079590 [Arachis hypogaea]
MQTHRVGILHTKWLEAQFKKKVESNPRIKIRELQAKAHKKWNVTVTKSMAAKSKQKTLSQIQGACREQYRRINDYCAELLRANPGSSVSLKVIRSPNFVQEGLLPALDEVIPRVDNRYCVRHLYNNFRKKFSGLELKNQMWRCAKFWSRSRFSFYSKCDSLVNNMSESFNVVIVEAREKLIVTMLEDIRVYIMTRWAANRARIQVYQGNIMPTIRKKLEKRAKYARDWRPFWSAASKYEVMCGLDKFVVDLAAYDYYKKDAYLRCYQEVIHLLNGPDLWERSQYDDVMPPPYRKPSHRLVKKRKRGPGDEDNRSQTHLSCRGQTQRCSNCGALGHKKSGCTKPNKKNQSASQQVGKGPKKARPTDHSTQPKNQTKNVAGPAPPQSNPKAPSSQPLPKKSSAAASSTSKKDSHSQPTKRKRHFSVIQTGAPHIPMQKLKLMAKLPPSAWGNL